MAKKGGQFFLKRLRRENFQSVAFIWVLPLLGHNKFGSKTLPLFGVLPLFIQKIVFEVYALIRSVASISVLLLFGGVTPILDTFWRFWGISVCQTGLLWDVSKQRPYTTVRGLYQRPSRGCISHSLRVQGPNTPS